MTKLLEFVFSMIMIYLLLTHFNEFLPWMLNTVIPFVQNIMNWVGAQLNNIIMGS